MVYRIDIIFSTIQGDCFIVLHFVKRFMWYIFVFTYYSYYLEFFCLGTESCLLESHCHGWVRYIDTTKITVLRFVWDCLVFTQYSYYRDFFCLRPASCLRNHHCHVWVRYMDTTKITVWCMSLLLLSIDLRLLYYLLCLF